MQKHILFKKNWEKHKSTNQTKFADEGSACCHTQHEKRSRTLAFFTTHVSQQPPQPISSNSINKYATKSMPKSRLPSSRARHGDP
uniref:Uncharacterized protein n=1 Tax=Arundo donax TaxID=35708 RepID=A0A0A8YFQ0_ARUDO